MADLDAITAAGCNDVIVKPLNKSELLRKIAENIS
jgi:CheY-like chemotaxis protein